MAHITSLPAEISNVIITLAVVDPSAQGPHQPPALARTCKTLRSLTLPIYYGQHTWHMERADDGMALIKRQRALFPHFTVRHLLLGSTARIYPYGVAPTERWLYSLSVTERTGRLRICLGPVIAKHFFTRREYPRRMPSQASVVNKRYAKQQERGEKGDDRILAVLEWMVAQRRPRGHCLRRIVQSHAVSSAPSSWAMVGMIIRQGWCISDR